MPISALQECDLVNRTGSFSDDGVLGMKVEMRALEAIPSTVTRILSRDYLRTPQNQARQPSEM